MLWSGRAYGLDKLMGDEGLWEVKGHERVVFDITKKMELGSTGVFALHFGDI